MLQVLVFLLLLFANRDQVDSFSIPIVSDIQDIIGIANDVSDIFSGNLPLKSLIGQSVDNTAVALQKIDALSNQVSQLANDLTDKMEEILTVMLERIPLAQEVSTAMVDFQKQISRVDDLFDDFQDLVASKGEFNNFTLNQFLSTATSKNSGDLPDVLNSMHALFVPARAATIRDSLLQLLVRARNASLPGELCNPAFSFQERLYEIFNIVIVTEMRGYIMTLFAYDTLAKRLKSSFVREVQKARAKYVLRSEEYILNTQKKMSSASRELYRCDPPAHIPDETYVEMEGFMSRFLMDESQANRHHSCDDTCSEISITELHGCLHWSNVWGTSYYEYCQNRGCLGKIYWCETLKETTACEYPSNSKKRLKWLKTDNGNFGPTSESCSDGQEKWIDTRTQSFSRCDPCLCRCTELNAQSEATRAISLFPQVTNIEENKVLSNVRFVSMNKMIHIQIEESPLLPSAHLNLNESSWIPLKNFTYKPTEPYGEYVSDDYVLNVNEHYTFLTVDRRGFNLDEILLPEGYVLTGVKMSLDGPDIEKSRIQIEAHATPLDFASGTLVPTSENPSIWITPHNQPHPHARYTEKRTEVDNGDRKDPRKSKKNVPFSKINEYIMFGPSSARDDVGTVTIPLFDAQPVAINRTLALGGIGVFDKSAKDYAGFITPKLMNIDLSLYMNTVLKKKQYNSLKKLYRESLAFDPPLKNQ